MFQLSIASTASGGPDAMQDWHVPKPSKQQPPKVRHAQAHETIYVL